MHLHSPLSLSLSLSRSFSPALPLHLHLSIPISSTGPCLCVFVSSHPVFLISLFSSHIAVPFSLPLFPSLPPSLPPWHAEIHIHYGWIALSDKAAVLVMSNGPMLNVWWGPSDSLMREWLYIRFSTHPSIPQQETDKGGGNRLALLRSLHAQPNWNGSETATITAREDNGMLVLDDGNRRSRVSMSAPYFDNYNLEKKN